MHQPTFARVEFEQDGYTTRRQKFLERLDGLVPWERFEAAIGPHYPKPGRGRRPYPLSVMLRIHIVQLCYNLSDPGTEDLLHEAESVRAFCHLTLRGPIPDETTILTFRHLLERHSLGSRIFELINEHLASEGLKLSEGSIVDATIISAPSSTQNRERRGTPRCIRPRRATSGISG